MSWKETKPLPWIFSTQSQAGETSPRGLKTQKINCMHPEWIISTMSRGLNRSDNFGRELPGEVVGLLGKGSATRNGPVNKRGVIKIHLPEKSPDFPCNVEYSTQQSFSFLCSPQLLGFIISQSEASRTIDILWEILYRGHGLWCQFYISLGLVFMANVTRIAILELAFYGVTIPEERDFIPDELSRWGKRLLFCS